MRPEILQQFGNHFHSSDIDVGNLDDLLFRAESVALNLGHAGLSPDEIAGPLTSALQHTTPEMYDQFSEASDGFWDFDENCEAALKAILERIILTAYGGGTLAHLMTGEEYLREHPDYAYGQRTAPKG